MYIYAKLINIFIHLILLCFYCVYFEQIFSYITHFLFFVCREIFHWWYTISNPIFPSSHQFFISTSYLCISFVHTQHFFLFHLVLIYLQERLLSCVAETPYPENMVMVFIYSAFVKGDQTYFDIDSSGGVEGTQLYPQMRYTTISEYLNTLL